MWNPNGRVFCHSMLVGMWDLVIIGRWAANASQMMKMNIIRAVNDNMDPMDEITFHFMKASG